MISAPSSWDRAPKTLVIYFLSGKNVFCSNETTLCGLLNDFWMGAVHQKDKAMIKNMELSAPRSAPSSEKGRGAGD